MQFSVLLQLGREIATEEFFLLVLPPLFYHRTRRPTNAPSLGQQIVVLAPNPPPRATDQIINDRIKKGRPEWAQRFWPADPNRQGDSSLPALIETRFESADPNSKMIRAGHLVF